MLIGIEIEKCNDCPFIGYYCTYSEIYKVYKYFYFCEKANNILVTCNSANPVIKVPDWCPCKIEKGLDNG